MRSTKSTPLGIKATPRRLQVDLDLLELKFYFNLKPIYG